MRQSLAKRWNPDEKSKPRKLNGIYFLNLIGTFLRPGLGGQAGRAVHETGDVAEGWGIGGPVFCGKMHGTRGLRVQAGIAGTPVHRTVLAHGDNRHSHLAFTT